MEIADKSLMFPLLICLGPGQVSVLQHVEGCWYATDLRKYFVPIYCTGMAMSLAQVQTAEAGGNLRCRHFTRSTD